MLMASNKLKNRTLSKEVEYYQEIWNIKKTRPKAFENIDAVFKINSIDFSGVFLCL